MARTETEGCIVAIFRFGDLAFFFEGVGKVAIGIREVWLEFNSTTVSVDCKVDETLLVVDTSEVSVDDCIVW